MFRFISSKRYKDLENLSIKLSEMEARYDALTNEVQSCENLLAIQEKEIERLTEIEKASLSEDSNYVKLVFSNDLQKITPFIGFRPDCFESLFQEGLLKDGQEDNPHAIQLALMFMANDGLAQILEAFEEAPEN